MQTPQIESLNLRVIVQRIREDYALPVHGDHGIAHWARVLQNGLRLSETTGANVIIVSLFAIFHNSRRVNEGSARNEVRGSE